MQQLLKRILLLALLVASSSLSANYGQMHTDLTQANQRFFKAVESLDLNVDSYLSTQEYNQIALTLKDALIFYSAHLKNAQKGRFKSTPLTQKQMNKGLSTLIYYTNAAKLLMLSLTHPALATILSELPDIYSQIDRKFIRKLIQLTKRHFSSSEANYSPQGYLYDFIFNADKWPVKELPQWITSYLEQAHEVISKERMLTTRYYTDQEFKKVYYELKASLLYITGKVSLPKPYFIKIDQINSIQDKLVPGDIAVIRHFYKLTNVAFRGDWSHGLLYLGSWNKMSHFFDNDSKTRNFYSALCKREQKNCSNFSTYLNDTLPNVVNYYRSSSSFRGHDLPRVVLEGLGEGVVISNIYDALLKDQLAIFRPKTSKLARAQAIFRALSYVHRPYDYSFSLHSRQKLVCTEIILNAYSPAKGLDIPDFSWSSSTALGKPVSYATDIVDTYLNQNTKRKPLLDLIYYLKADKRQQRAFPQSSF